MARLSRLEKLFSAVAAHDWNRARATALAIAEDEETSQHLPAAQRLRAALTYVNGTAKMVAPNGHSFVSEEAMTPVAVAAGLEQLVLPTTTRKELRGLVEEWTQRDRLAAAGVRRRSRILLYGPPGCGKSLSAAALGFETGLPVHVVRLDAVVGSYLGETASRVHSLLRWAATHSSVLVFDEIDAIARRRGKLSDVAELDRVVVALLQELEHTAPSGLLVATTNRLDDLDDALFRRFDLVMKLPRPNRAALEAFTRREASKLGVRLTGALKNSTRAARSFADARRILEDALRHHVLAAPQDPRS
jgi:SpoVK/Ycf46/Vps4 family AAA+-type ATPase